MTMTDAAQELMPPDLGLIEALAEAALAALPAPWARPARAIALVVQDFPSDEVMEQMGIEDAYELTGLYEGIPLTEKSVMDQPAGPDAIFLFRRPILDEWIDRGDVPLGHLVAHVLIHELAHHFGWSDAEIARIAPWQD